MARPAATVLVAALLVLGGCGSIPEAGDTTAPEPSTVPEPSMAPDASPAETTEPPPVEISVEGDDPGIDANRTFERVRRLVGADVDPPWYVQYESNVEPDTFAISYGHRPFLELLGFGRSTLPTTVGGSAGISGVRMFYTTGATDAEIERVLAHEFVHVVQHRLGLVDAVEAAFDGTRPQTTDGTMAYDSVVEGSAEYVASEYERRYLPGEGTSAGSWDRNASSPAVRLYRAPYRYGERYVGDRIDSPREIDAVHESPPVTSEQVLHGYAPGEEPPRDLRVSSKDSGSPWSLAHRDTLGEMAIRIALEAELDGTAAARGAGGWGNDSVLTYRRGDSTGFAWVTRWDDATNASTFETVFERYLDERGERRDGRWRDGEDEFRIERPRDNTVIIVAGNESFARNATLAGDSGAIVVVPPRG